MKNADQSFEQESLSYFNRNYKEKDLANTKPNPHLQWCLEELKLDLNGRKILEIGCAGANNLTWLHRQYGTECWGIEPNQELINHLSRTLSFIKFKAATADSLPFEKNTFDLVILRSVLCWVDRQFLLQALGEALRVTRQWLLISDFSAVHPFQVPYKYKEGLYTWHTSYKDILLNTGFVELIYHRCGTLEKQNGLSVIRLLNNQELNESKHDWDRVETCVFKKNLNLIPIKEEKDFISG